MLVLQFCLALRERRDARLNENQITYAACIGMVVSVCKKSEIVVGRSEKW